jgi:hypothetical protein
MILSFLKAEKYFYQPFGAVASYTLGLTVSVM